MPSREEFLGNHWSGHGALSIDLESIMDCTQDSGKRCGSKHFVYEAWCYPGDGCIVWIERHKNGQYQSGAEYYTLEWDKSEVNGVWSASCSSNNNKFDGLCSAFETSN